MTLVILPALCSLTEWFTFWRSHTGGLRARVAGNPVRSAHSAAED
jgi:hypothetical protein